MGSEDHTERQLQHFVGEFVRLWEPQLDVRWKPRNYFSNCSDEGPHLSLLPDDLLPSLDRRLYRIRNRLDQVHRTSLGKSRVSDHFSRRI